MVEPNTALLNYTAKLLISLASKLFHFMPVILNYITRPKINFEIKNANLKFKDKNDVEHNINYPCIILMSQHDCALNIERSRLNKEPLQSIFGGDPNFLNLKPDQVHSHIILNCDLYKFTSEHWADISQNQLNYKIKKSDKILIPLWLNKGRSSVLFSPRQDCKIPFWNKNLCLELEINNKRYDYELPWKGMCKATINWLAFKND